MTTAARADPDDRARATARSASRRHRPGARVLLVEPAHALGFEEVTRRVLDHRRAVELVFGHRDTRAAAASAAAARFARDRARRPPPGCRPRCRRRSRCGADRRRPRPRARAPIRTRRRSRRPRPGTCLGREAVVDRHDDRAGVVADRRPSWSCVSSSPAPSRRRGTRRSAAVRVRGRRVNTRTGIAPAGPGMVRSQTSCTGAWDTRVRRAAIIVAAGSGVASA